MDRLLDRLQLYMVWAGASVIIFLTGSVVFEVIMRYFLNRPTRWMVDFGEYSLVFITFLGGAWVLSRERHVKVEILMDRLSPRVQRGLNTATSIVGVLICAVFLWYSSWLTWRLFETGELFMKAVVIPKWPIFMVLPVGMLVVTLQFLRRAWLYARGKEPKRHGG